MRIRKIILISIIVVLTGLSVLCAKILASPISQASYIALQIDAEINDADIVSRLQNEGIDNIESLSAQKIFLDDFGSLKEIPFHQYADYVFPFDPRNDAYAEKLKRFFSQNGKQFLFIPLEKQKLSSHGIAKKIDEILAPIPYELQFVGKEMPKKLPWLLFFASLTAIILFFKKLRPYAGIFFPLAGFLFFGPSGFILSALLIIITSLSVNPLRECLRNYHFRNVNFRNDKPRTKKSVFENMMIYRYSCISASMFLILYITIMILTGVSIMYSMIMLAVLLGLFVFSLKNEVTYDENAEHKRFLPIPIMGEKKNILCHGITGIPFAAAAVIFLFSSFYMNNFGSNFDFDQTRFVTKADFEEHIRFQQNFSLIPLGKTIDNYQYRTYKLGDDGLVFDEGTPYADNQELPDNQNEAEMFLFPLEDLINHMQGKSEQTIRWFSPETIVSVSCFLLLVFFAFFAEIKQKGRKKNHFMYNDKRITA